MQKTRELLSPEHEIAHLSEDERRRLLQEETIVVEFEPDRAKRVAAAAPAHPADRRRAHALLDGIGSTMRSTSGSVCWPTRFARCCPSRASESIAALHAACAQCASGAVAERAP